MESFELQRWANLGHKILTEVEGLLGKRQPCHFGGFFEVEKNAPSFEYRPLPTFATCVINLNKGLENEIYAAFEISHEVIHLLTPVPPLEVTNFEEGLATYFSVYYLKSIGEIKFIEYKIEEFKINNPEYFDAYQSVKEVPGLFEKIKQIRIKEPEVKFSKFRIEHFKELTEDMNLIHYWSGIFNS